MTYSHTIIDFKRKPTQKRATKVLAWIDKRVSATQPTAVSMEEIYDVYGNVSRGLSKEFFHLTLEVADPYFNSITGVCKKYLKRTQGVRTLLQGLGLDQAPLDPHLKQQLETGVFEYKQKSDRLWNPAQFWDKRQRTEQLARYGFSWGYDIDAAAPTLLYQRAQHIHHQQHLWQGKHKSAQLRLHTLEQMLSNKKQFRQQLAQEADATIGEVKTVVNALFQGSSLSTAWNSKLFDELGRRDSLIQRLRHSETLTLLRKDIKLLWSVLSEDIPRTRTAKGRLKRLGGVEKSQLYRQLELEVGTVIRRYLAHLLGKHEYLWIHDGWYLREYVDPLVIEQRVRSKTNYSIKLSVTEYV